MAGTRYNEFWRPIGPIAPIAVTRFPILTDELRTPAMSSIGFSDPDATMPHCDTKHGDSYLAGLCSRLVADRVRPGRKTLAAMRNLSAKFAKQFEQIDNTAEIDFYKWLNGSSYTGIRREMMIDAYKRVTEDPSFRFTRYVKSHVKNEQYMSFKPSRLINARPDEFKVVLGPVIHEMEKLIFKNSSFAKYFSQTDRWKKILERLDVPGSSVLWTDHTSYESVFSRDFTLSVVIPIYEHVLGDHPMAKEFIKFYIEYVLPVNGHTLKSKWFNVSGVQAEMSGEMDTSCKNGTANLLGATMANELTRLALLTREIVGWAALSDSALASMIDATDPVPVASVLGNDLEGVSFRMFAEGDDGVVISDVTTDEGAFSALGFNVKMITGATLEHNDFCSIDGTLNPDIPAVRNPLKVLGSFGWLDGQFIDAKRSKKLLLYRARAMSLIFDHRNTPILGAFAQWVLRATKHVDMQKFEELSLNKWDRDWFRERLLTREQVRLLTPDVHPEARRVIESRYGISAEHQRQIEAYFENKNDVSFIDCKELRLYWPEEWQDYAARYTVPSRGCCEPILYALYDNYSTEAKLELLKSGIVV